jgi:hypothetical protein
MRASLAFVLVACSTPGGGGPGGDDTLPPDASIDPPGDGTTQQIDPAWPPDTALPPEFDFPPYLNLLDGRTVVVSWRTGAATTGIVRYGTTEALGSMAASTVAANLHHVSLTDLQPGSAYYYEVAIDNTSAIRRGVFVVPGRTAWRWVHFGEFHAPSNAQNAAKFTAAIRMFRPHVIVESGDMVDDGNNLNDWRSYMRTSAPWISNVLLLPSHSNHVNGTGGNTNLRDLFVIPHNERWYLTRYNQVQFFSLDSTYAANSDVEATEVPWLRSNAQSMHDGADDPKFVIASWHHPACSSQYFTRQGERNWVHDNFIAAFMSNGGIDLILAAHDKYYERSTLTGGVVHLITNIGQVSPEIPGGNHAGCTPIKTSRTNQSVAFFTMTGNMLDAKILDQNGADLDAFSITK